MAYIPRLGGGQGSTAAEVVNMEYVTSRVPGLNAPPNSLGEGVRVFLWKKYCGLGTLLRYLPLSLKVYRQVQSNGGRPVSLRVQLLGSKTVSVSQQSTRKFALVPSHQRYSLQVFVFLLLAVLFGSDATAATVTTRVTGAANWNTASTWIQNRTGMVTLNGASVTINTLHSP